MPKLPKISKNPNTFYAPSPFRNILDINTRKPSTLEDWNRAGKTDEGKTDKGKKDKVIINGESVQTLLIKSGLTNLPTDELFTENIELRVFLGEHVLADMDDVQHNKAINNAVMLILHQGGLLNPVSGAASLTLAKNHIIPVDENNMREYETHITRTKKGFKVQEIVTQKKCRMIKDGQIKDILPDRSKKYVYNAEATIDVNFVDDPKGDVILTVESNTIAYGSSTIEHLLDPRDFLQKLVDYLKSIFNQQQATNTVQARITVASTSEADKTLLKNKETEDEPQECTTPRGP